MTLPPFTRRTKTGVAIIYLAGLGWTFELVLPFLKISHKGPLFIVLLIVSELLFALGVAVLGKPVYNELKKQLLSALRRRSG